MLCHPCKQPTEGMLHSGNVWWLQPGVDSHYAAGKVCGLEELGRSLDPVDASHYRAQTLCVRCGH